MGLNSNHKRIEIGYVIGDKSYWGKGIATQAISIIIEKIKKMNIYHKVHATCASANSGSIRCLEKNNFVLEGVKKKHVFYNDEWFDELDYGLILK